MNPIFRPSLLLLLAITGLDAAELPKKAPLSRYTSLWDNSPFTTKPVTDDKTPLEDPFKDLALKGVAPIAGGYLITLINKKNPAEAVPPIDTDRPSEFKVLSIERNPDEALGTIVHLQRGTQVGTITYDEKLSILKAPPAKRSHNLPGQPQIPGQPGQPPTQPGQPPVQPGQPNQPQPRPRVVPPSTPGAQPAAQPAAQPGASPFSRGGPTSTRGGSSTSGSSRGYQRPTRR